MVKTTTLETPRRSLSFVAAGALALAAVIGTTAIATAQESEEPSEATTEEAVAADGIDGTWIVNTELGSFEGTDELEPFSSSWVGFRVAEVLRNIGEAEAVGRTPFVTGELTASGSVIDDASIEVDLTTITTDQSRRDPWVQDALDTEAFPTAAFASSEAVDLGAVPVDGEPFAVALPGTLTIRDIEQPVDLEITGQRVGDIVVVVGTLTVDFTEFDVTMPVLGPVVSVEDVGSLEWQLFFERQG